MRDDFSESGNQTQQKEDMKLVENKPIPIKSDYKMTKNSVQISSLRDLKRNRERIEKPEMVYYLWFLYLKLLLELEDKGLEFPLIGKSKKQLKVGRDIKIDREYYSGWDLEEMYVAVFDDNSDELIYSGITTNGSQVTIDWWGYRDSGSDRGSGNDLKEQNYYSDDDGFPFGSMSSAMSN